MSQKYKNPFENRLFEYDQEQSQELLNDIIPTDPQEFYEWVGLINHPRTGEPVKKLAHWQYNIWLDRYRFKRRLAVKSQKVGESFAALDEDFQVSLTTCKGKDVLVIGQTQAQADEHILKLKTRIINSENASKYLITEPSELLFREQKTKVKVAAIKNPDNPKRPTRIIALGMAESGLWSWSNVGHIHMSDPTVANVIDDGPLFAAAFSRLANTDGTMLIETPPRGPHGQTFELYNKYLMKQQNLGERDFKIYHVTAQDAVNEGLITQEFLDEERMRLGALYPQYYEAQFISVSGNLFAQTAIDKCILDYDLTSVNELTNKYMAIDIGYSSSKFAIIIGEITTEKKIRILLAEQIAMGKYPEMMSRILRYYNEDYPNIKNIAVDATGRQEFAMTLKSMLPEPENDNWEYVKEKMHECEKNRWDIKQAMRVVPVLFTMQSKETMASHARRILEHPKQFLQISPKFNDLIVALRSAVFDDRGQLDKERSANDDMTDAFLMLMRLLEIGRPNQ